LPGRKVNNICPVIPLELKPELWAGARLFSVARKLFEKMNALAWAEDRSNFAILVAHLAPEDPGALDPTKENPNRAVDQRVGPGRVMVLSKDDRLQYVAPPSDSFEHTAKSVEELKGEVHRILGQMSLAAGNSHAALSRSGLSKQIDQSVFYILARALGDIVRRYAATLFTVVSIGRGEPTEFKASGCEEFPELMDVQAAAEEQGLVDTLSLPSPTFRAMAAYDFIRRRHPNASPEELAKIKEELDAAFKTKMEDELVRSSTLDSDG
jgi:hypothetical protein